MVYLDLLLLLNFFYDFLLLLTVGLVNKRHINFKKIFLASLVGAFSFLIVIFNLNSYITFLYEIVVSVILVIIGYGYHNIKYTVNNLVYLYMCSVILGGFSYYLNLEFKVSGNVVILIVSPVILGVYLYQARKLRVKQNLNYPVKIVFKDNKKVVINGFIDSGNKLKDPVTNKYVIIMNKGIYDSDNYMFVPFRGVNKSGLLKCFSLKYIEINNQKFRNYLIGISEEKINLDGSDCILNYKLMEDLNV